MAAEFISRVKVPTKSGTQATNYAEDFEPHLPHSADLLQAEDLPATTVTHINPVLLTNYGTLLQNITQETEATDLAATNSSLHFTPFSSYSIASSQLKPALSPLASAWTPDQCSPHVDCLYPPGRNQLGVDYSTSDEAWVALEFGNHSNNDFTVPADATPDLDKTTFLKASLVKLKSGKCFEDKILPKDHSQPAPNKEFTPDYFVNLHNRVRESVTYNFAGARIELEHTKINVQHFRHLLSGYDDIEVCQFLQFGFPLGLAEEIILEPTLKNHQSAYTYFTYVDALLDKELACCGVTGPFHCEPFEPTMISPMMTAPKNPGARRPVFDASFGDWSLNENTPQKSYLGGPYNFSFPTVLNFAELVIKQGQGCLLYKRDLSRWFLQLPVDPADYDKLGFVWRGQLWLWVAYVWGTRHAGYAGQRVASAILWILKKLGFKKFKVEYNAVVYMDDFGGCERGSKAIAAFEDLGKLLSDLGIQESEKKACSPSTKMLFLGVEFDTVDMAMRIDVTKRMEITALAQVWSRKTVATKEELQSILGKLMWVSKVVRYSRCFVSRIIASIKSLKNQKQKITLSVDLKKDFLWWSTFLDVFNGVELLIPDTVYCNILGDATLAGGGSWNEMEKEYISRKFPFHLQSPSIYIHIKEFWMVILAAKVWGSKWTGRRIAIYCDNEAVCKTIIHQKPKDPELQRCLRELLFFVCKFKFQPIILRVSTKDNDIADFISRVFDEASISKMFLEKGLEGMRHVTVLDDMFNFEADW